MAAVEIDAFGFLGVDGAARQVHGIGRGLGAAIDEQGARARAFGLQRSAIGREAAFLEHPDRVGIGAGGMHQRALAVMRAQGHAAALHQQGARAILGAFHQAAVQGGLAARGPDGDGIGAIGRDGRAVEGHIAAGHPHRLRAVLGRANRRIGQVDPARIAGDHQAARPFGQDAHARAVELAAADGDRIGVARGVHRTIVGREMGALVGVHPVGLVAAGGDRTIVQRDMRVLAGIARGEIDALGLGARRADRGVVQRDFGAAPGGHAARAVAARGQGGVVQADRGQLAVGAQRVGGAALRGDEHIGAVEFRTAAFAHGVDAARVDAVVVIVGDDIDVGAAAVDRDLARADEQTVGGMAMHIDVDGALISLERGFGAGQDLHARAAVVFRIRLLRRDGGAAFDDDAIARALHLDGLVDRARPIDLLGLQGQAESHRQGHHQGGDAPLGATVVAAGRSTRPGQTPYVFHDHSRLVKTVLTEGIEGCREACCVQDVAPTTSW
ncbi:hypothetical protein L543_1271 [Bordetella hinzii L60]|nr:hypothetical protein L543_1271 [Bordetella hinzii L60]